MSAKWFCKIGEKKYGPLPLEQLQRMATRGQITPETFVRSEHDHQWLPADKVPNLFSPAPPKPPAPQPPVVSPPVAKPLVATPLPLVASPQPSASPVIPMGKPVIPVGVPVPVVVQPQAIVSPMPTNPAATAAGPAGETRKKSNKDRQLFIGLLATAGLILIVGGYLLFWPKNSKVAVAEKNSKQSSIPFTDFEASSSPTPTTSTDEQGTAPSTAPSSQPTTQPVATPATTEKPTAEIKKKNASPSETMIRSVERFTNTANAKRLSMKTAMIQFVGAWWESAESKESQDGKTESVESDDVSSDSDSAEPTNKTRNGAGRRFLCIEISVTSPPSATAPLSFTSWNGTTDKQLAAMADNHGHILELVPVAKTPSLARLTTGVKLKPSQVANDILVFEEPTSDFEFVQLALSYQAVGQGDRLFGFKISNELIADERPSAKPQNLAATPRPIERNSDGVPTLDEINASISKMKDEPDLQATAKEETGASKPAATKKENEKPATGKPAAEEMSIEDLKKSIEATLKNKEADKPAEKPNEKTP